MSEAIALDLMARSRLADLKADAAELAELISEKPISPMPEDDHAKVQAFMPLLLEERDRFRRLLTLVAMGL